MVDQVLWSTPRKDVDLVAWATSGSTLYVLKVLKTHYLAKIGHRTLVTFRSSKTKGLLINGWMSDLNCSRFSFGIFYQIHFSIYLDLTFRRVSSEQLWEADVVLLAAAGVVVAVAVVGLLGLCVLPTWHDHCCSLNSLHDLYSLLHGLPAREYSYSTQHTFFRGVFLSVTVIRTIVLAQFLCLHCTLCIVQSTCTVITLTPPTPVIIHLTDFPQNFCWLTSLNNNLLLM